MGIGKISVFRESRVFFDFLGGDFAVVLSKRQGFIRRRGGFLVSFSQRKSYCLKNAFCNPILALMSTHHKWLEIQLFRKGSWTT